MKKALLYLTLLTSLAFSGAVVSQVTVGATEVNPTKFVGEFTLFHCGGGVCDGDKYPLMSVIQTVVETMAYAVGMISVLVIVIAGFMYVTANGDANQIAKAKNIILYAVVGIVVAMSAFAIVQFVSGRFK